MKNKTISARQIYRKINHSLSEEEELAFAEWLGQDEAHHRYYEQMQRIFQQEQTPEISSKEVEDAWPGFKLQMQKRRKQARKRHWIRNMSVAASVIITFSCCVFWYTREYSHEKPNSRMENIVPGKNSAILKMADGSTYSLGKKNYSLQEKTGSRIIIDSSKLSYSPPSVTREPKEELIYNKLIVPRGGEYKLELEDGTKIWINSASCVQFPVAFSRTKREVYLEGEAYFEVARDTTKPFIVHAQGQKITVLGTCFGVSCYTESQNDYTTLISGKVNVEFEKEGKSFVLQPGTQVFYDKENGRIIKRDVDVMEYVAWREEKYVFKQKRLEDILTTLSRWYDFEVFYNNEEVKEIKFSGEVKRFADFNYLLQLIERTSDVKFIINQRIVQVTK